jgi:hypothetical protein
VQDRIESRREFLSAAIPLLPFKEEAMAFPGDAKHWGWRATTPIFDAALKEKKQQPRAHH